MNDCGADKKEIRYASRTKLSEGGYVLFPGSGTEEQVRATTLYKSIDKVNIGALPLRPGYEVGRKFLCDFIKGLINKSTEEQLVGMKSQALKGTMQEIEEAGALENRVQSVSKVKGKMFECVVSSGLCPCPKNQCGNPNEVKMLVLPFTIGAHLFRVKDGCIPKTKTSSELTNGKDALFKNITFPDETCYVWEVEMVS